MATFSQTWNASFLAYPADNEYAIVLGLAIRDLKNAIDERFGIDHSLDGDGNDGMHTVTRLMKQASDPTCLADVGMLYTKAVDNIIELFYKAYDGNTATCLDPVQMTSNGRIGNYAKAAAYSTSNTNLTQSLLTEVLLHSAYWDADSMLTANRLVVPRTAHYLVIAGSTVANAGSSLTAKIYKGNTAIDEQLPFDWQATGTTDSCFCVGIPYLTEADELNLRIQVDTTGKSASAKMIVYELP